MATDETVSVGDIVFTARTEEFVGACILECTVGTNGYKGGDSGSGSRTLFVLRDLASTDMSVSVAQDSWGKASSVKIVFGGDFELQNFIDALKFAVETLEEQSKGA